MSDQIQMLRGNATELHPFAKVKDVMRVIRTLQADARKNLPPDTPYELRLGLTEGGGMCWLSHETMDDKLPKAGPEDGYFLIGKFRT